MKPLFGITLLLGVLLCACDQEAPAPRIEVALPYYFEDDFETATGSLDELFEPANSRWSGVQNVSPGGGTNLLALDTTNAAEGRTALSCTAFPSDAVLSKIDIEKQGFFAPVGSTVIIEADFYLPPADQREDLFLIDLECCSCWDPTVADNQCPGIRLKFNAPGDYLAIERGKILGTTLGQTERAFPSEEWVSVKWEMQLSDTDSGSNRLFINQQQVIDQRAGNLPNAEAFRAEFAANGIDFELQEPPGYDRVQIGATANPTEHQQHLLVDNFRLSIVE